MPIKKLFLFLFLLPSVGWSGPIYVFLHGLYEDPGIFEPINQDLTAQGFKTLNVQLAGHGTDTANAYHLKFPTWFSQIDEITSTAESNGDEVVFVTHSLGSILALDQALSGKRVSKIIAVEPALKINTSLIKSACVLKNIIPDGKAFLPLVRLFLNISSVNRPIPFNMACEAGKIRTYIFKKYDVKNEAELAAKVHTPLLIFNNLHDLAVSRKSIKTFFKHLPRDNQSQYFEISERHMPHGAFIRLHPDELKNAILKSTGLTTN